MIRFHTAREWTLWQDDGSIEDYMYIKEYTTPFNNYLSIKDRPTYNINIYLRNLSRFSLQHPNAGPLSPCTRRNSSLIYHADSLRVGVLKGIDQDNLPGKVHCMSSLVGWPTSTVAGSEPATAGPSSIQARADSNSSCLCSISAACSQPWRFLPVLEIVTVLYCKCS